MIQLILKYLKIKRIMLKRDPREWYNNASIVQANGGYVIPYTR